MTTEPRRCTECAEWTLRGVAHRCPLAKLVADRRRIARAELAERQREAVRALEAA